MLLNLQFTYSEYVWTLCNVAARNPDAIPSYQPLLTQPRHWHAYICISVSSILIPLWSTSTAMQLIMKRFNLSVFFGYFVLSNGPNWENFCIISIFWVILGQNLCFLPHGWPIYRAPFNCNAVDYEDIAIRFTLNVFLITLCYLMAKLGGFLHIINIWCRF